MIRESKHEDTDSIMRIWLASTVQAHAFIPKEFWLGSFTAVKDIYLPASKTYVYEEDGNIAGFISILNDSYIGALFVTQELQNKGIGTELLRFVQKRYSTLSLCVYSENTNAIDFYLKHSFTVQHEQVNADTEAKELAMAWKIR